MGMPAMQDRHWTVADVHALPDDSRHRYEVVDGELLVSPAPALRHQLVTRAITRALEDYLQAHPFGVVLNGPGEVAADEHSAVQPDVFVLPLVDGRPPRDWPTAQSLLLVIEVLSPSTARHDRVVKRKLYQRLGAEYWIVDPEARLVERWSPGATQPDVIDGEVTWHPALAVAPLVLSIAELIHDVLREP